MCAPVFEHMRRLLLIMGITKNVGESAKSREKFDLMLVEPEFIYLSITS